jgi:hypothetical protein
LLLKGFAEIVRALAQLVEQPRVLNGDHRLRGEVLKQRYLLVSERPDFHSENLNCADEFVFLEHWHGNTGTGAGDFR